MKLSRALLALMFWGIVLVVVIIVLVAVASPSSETTTTTVTTPPATNEPATEAPSLAPDSAGRDAANKCAHGTTGNAHASCPFAERVQEAFASSYRPSHTPPATVNAYSPVTNHTYTLHCSLAENGTLVECVTGDAAVVFPLESANTPSSESAEGKDEVGSASHAGDAAFCSIHTCIGDFTEEEGTVVECADGSFSHAGGIAGACSDNGGEAQGEESEAAKKSVE